MLATLTPHAAAALTLTIIVFYAFATEKAPIQIISLVTIALIALGLYVFPLPGMDPNSGLALAFQGFGHPALITICALMIMGRGLVVTGALDPAARALRGVWQLNQQLGLLVTLLLAFFLSMFINDTPVLVLLLPIMAQLATQGAMPASRTLIPLNAAVLIGGMGTTIGTSTNLLVVSIAQDLGMRSIGVFYYTDIVLIAGLIALPYIWLVMPRLLPNNQPAAVHARHRYFASLRLADASPHYAKPYSELAAVLPAGLTLGANVPVPLQPSTRIALIGTEEALIEGARVLGGSLGPPWHIARLREQAAREGEDVQVAELTVTADSRLIGQSIDMAGVAGVAIIGLHQPRRFTHSPRPASAEAPLMEGDVLLTMGTPDALQRFAQDDGLLLLEGAKDLPRSRLAVVALAIMAVAVGVASVGLVPIAVSSLAGAVAMFVTGCVKFDRVGRALSAKVIVLIAASLAIGQLMLVSGAAAWLGQLLALGLQHVAPAIVVGAIMLFVTLLTNFASNATAAAVGTPIAFSLATQLGMPVEPLVLAVLFGCNLCYATPVAYQTNMLIMAEGDYQFRDYMRTGVPLVLIMVVTLSLLLAWRYGL